MAIVKEVTKTFELDLEVSSQNFDIELVATSQEVTFIAFCDYLEIMVPRMKD